MIEDAVLRDIALASSFAKDRSQRATIAKQAMNVVEDFIVYSLRIVAKYLEQLKKLIILSN